MSPFEYIMVLVSIVIGLAITHLLTAIAAGVHRLRGHGEPLTIDLIYSLWVGYVLIWLVSFWWYEFAFQGIRESWTFGIYLFVISFAIVLFLLAAILVPHRLQGVKHTYSYFMEGRRWFFCALIVAVGFDVVDTLLKGADYASRDAAMWQAGVFVLCALAGLATRRRGVQLTAAVIAFVLNLAYMFQQLGVLGGA